VSRFVCQRCGRVQDELDLNFRFRLPDPILDLTEERRERVEGDDPESDSVTAAGVGTFLRVLLPVRLTGGGRITFATWLCVDHEEDYHRARRLWHSPDYPSLRLEGILSNAIQPWGEPLYGRATVAVRESDALPYVAEIHDGRMAEVITAEWPRAWVLARMPEKGPCGHGDRTKSE
jgi:hypothetical protein